MESFCFEIICLDQFQKNVSDCQGTGDRIGELLEDAFVLGQSKM